ncbi:bile acid:sodium symporter family protein [Erythrobacter sp. SDW2]|uniref:bile acid:sodium symporter family protein n=1 Tax=Erythrobacter sp. SDW2 TaxID=2907154 RepID=UPI001F1E66E6|nr:bile acid:sodium symporter family protein [Erythrobacter sp. SDW2]UIP06376.1 bile acid:sodium symporter family protein [Erythrobacter sp. SDW2]
MSEPVGQPRWIALATNLFAVWTVLGVAWAWLVPGHFAWITGSQIAGQPLISVMLGVIMLGMGLTLTLEDFRKVLAMPRCVAAGVALQFTVMPLAGVLAAWAFGLEQGLAVGIILVACCPGGTASNVVAYLARANVALSVAMTLCSTLVAIVATPLLTGWLGGVYVEIDQWSLFRNMVAIVLIPVVAGVLLNTLFPHATRQVALWSPLVSILAIVLIVGAIVGNSKTLIIEHAGVLLLAVFVLHATGFALGWLAPRLLGFGRAEERTISIEVGMQNSGLGASLAAQPSFAAQFANPLQAALAPVPSAISSVYHVVIGSLLAGLWSRSGGGR